MLKMLNVTSHADPYLHVHHSRCLLCMSTDVILADWQETFRSTASRLAADLKVSCQPAGRRHFLKNTLWQNDSVLDLAIFTLLFNKGFVSARIVHAHGNQLVPQLLLKHSDTLYTQCRTFAWRSLMPYKYFLTKWQHFELSHFLTLCFLIRVLLVLR